MLTREEQQQIIDQVKRIIRNDRIRRTRIQQLTMSEKVARESYEREITELADLLKEIG